MRRKTVWLLAMVLAAVCIETAAALCGAGLVIILLI